MQSINTSTISGRLVADPVGANDGKIAKFAVAVSRSFRRDGGDWQEDVSFVDVVAYAGLSSLMLKKASKGESIVVAGRLHQERWEAQDGSKRSRLVLVALTIAGDFVFKPNDAEEEGANDPAMDPDGFNAAVEAGVAAALARREAEPSLA
jgi:single-strand DNA-binding protein